MNESKKAKQEIINFLSELLGEVKLIKENNEYYIIKILKEENILRHINFSCNLFPDSSIQCNYILIFNRKKIIERDIYFYEEPVIDFILLQRIEDFKQLFPSGIVNDKHPIVTDNYPHLRFSFSSIDKLALATEIGKEWKDILFLYLKSKGIIGHIEFIFPYNPIKKEAFPKSYIPLIKKLKNKYPKFFDYQEI